MLGYSARLGWPGACANSVTFNPQYNIINHTYMHLGLLHTSNPLNNKRAINIRVEHYVDIY